MNNPDEEESYRSNFIEITRQFFGCPEEKAKEYYDTILPSIIIDPPFSASSPRNRNSRDENRISYRELAMICLYEKIEMSMEYCRSMAKKFHVASPAAINNYYYKFGVNYEFSNYPGSRTTLRYMIKSIKKIMPHLQEKAQIRAKADLENLRKL